MVKRSICKQQYILITIYSCNILKKSSVSMGLFFPISFFLSMAVTKRVPVLLVRNQYKIRERS